MARYHPVDVHIGHRVRQRRTLLGLGQTDLAKALDVTFQQVQRYETGLNRLSASRLFEFAGILAVPVSYFFEGMTSETATGKVGAGRSKTRLTDKEAVLFNNRKTLQLVRWYYKIKDVRHRKLLIDFVAGLARE